MIHETHELFTIDDFTKKDTRCSMLAKLVVENHARICKNCGEQNPVFLKYDCGLVGKIRRAIGSANTTMGVNEIYFELKREMDADRLTDDEAKMLDQMLGITRDGE